ncbi:MAG: AMP-binding protein, partial [Bauldia sp.]|nr:AMP-binding protein [Bauldia sp.]
MSENLVSIIADRSPGRERTFLTTLDGRRLSYGEAFDLAGRYANVLSQKGVAVGDRVAVQVEKSPEALVLYLACLRAGAVFLPLNTGYTIGEVEYFIDDARPRLVVSSPGKRDAIAPVAARLGVAAVETLGTENDGSLPRLASEAGTDFATVGRDADDLAAILYTSGTTGRS